MSEKYMNRLLMEMEPMRSGMTGSPLSVNVVVEWLKMAAIVVVVVLIGLFVAKTLARFAGTVVRRAKIDKAFAKLGWSKQLEMIGLAVKPSMVVAWIVKWFIIIAVFSGIVNYLGAQQLAGFLNDVLAYLPNVIIAVVVLVVGSLIAGTVRTAVERVLGNTSNVQNKALVASVPYYAIMTITVLTALNHLGIGGHMIEILFTGVVIALSLALGLAFGLGGKEHAARILDRLSQNE